MRHLINQSLAPVWDNPVNTSLKRAAVLLPLVERLTGTTLILTQRTAHLTHHGGQICFPGGTSHADDADPVATALRETEEEIGLQRTDVDIAGFLENCVTSTGFLIVPVVGFVKPFIRLIPDPFEVADIFEVPLEFVLNPANHEQHSAFYQGRQHHYYVINYQDRVIWGATAKILVNFYQRLTLITNESY